VADADVTPMHTVEPSAIAEAQRLCPELLGTDLVNLSDATWLHALRWSAPEGLDRQMARARGSSWCTPCTATWPTPRRTAGARS
jgi:hypothetical protein